MGDLMKSVTKEMKIPKSDDASDDPRKWFLGKSEDTQYVDNLE